MSPQGSHSCLIPPRFNLNPLAGPRSLRNSELLWAKMSGPKALQVVNLRDSWPLWSTSPQGLALFREYLFGLLLFGMTSVQIGSSLKWVRSHLGLSTTLLFVEKGAKVKCFYCLCQYWDSHQLEPEIISSLWK